MRTTYTTSHVLLGRADVDAAAALSPPSMPRVERPPQQAHAPTLIPCHHISIMRVAGECGDEAAPHSTPPPSSRMVRRNLGGSRYRNSNIGLHSARARIRQSSSAKTERCSRAHTTCCPRTHTHACGERPGDRPRLLPVIDTP